MQAGSKDAWRRVNGVWTLEGTDISVIKRHERSWVILIDGDESRLATESLGAAKEWVERYGRDGLVEHVGLRRDGEGLANDAVRRHLERDLGEQARIATELTKLAQRLRATENYLVVDGNDCSPSDFAEQLDDVADAIYFSIVWELPESAADVRGFAAKYGVDEKALIDYHRSRLASAGGRS